MSAAKVAGFLKTARSRGAELWLEEDIKWGAARRPTSAKPLDEAAHGAARRFDQRGPSLSKSAAGALSKTPQAMVKRIRNGGARGRKGLAAQLEYIGRGGDIDLERSSALQGAKVDPVALENFARDWGVGRAEQALPKGGDASDKAPQRGADKTAHFVVSFPNGVDQEAAYRAGRAWAAELFESGQYGGRWDYVTAFHTDTQHPHMHVVVKRRGLSGGTWLKVSRRSEINYDVMRDVQVLAAAQNSIDLIATRRAARGQIQRPLTDPEIRRSKRERRKPRPRLHNETSARKMAREVLHFATAYEGFAELLGKDHPEIAQALKGAAWALRNGKAIGDGAFSTREAAIMAQDMSKRVEDAREKNEALLKQLGAARARLGDGADAEQRQKLDALEKTLLADAQRLKRYGDERTRNDGRSSGGYGG